MAKQIAYRFMKVDGPAWYVSEIKGNGGVDWGYTNDASKALPINTHVWRQFAKDVRECGGCALSIPAVEAKAA